MKFFLGNVVSSQRNIFGHGIGGIFAMLQEQEFGPFGMPLPQFEESRRTLQSASSGEMKERGERAFDIGKVKILRGEPAEVAGGMMSGEDFEGVFALAEDMVDFSEEAEVSLRKSFLIRDENIGVSGRDPAWEDPLHKNVEIKPWSSRAPLAPERDFAAMTARDQMAGGFKGGRDEVDIPVKPDSVGAGDEVDLEGRSGHDLRKMTLRRVVGNGKLVGHERNCLASQ